MKMHQSAPAAVTWAYRTVARDIVAVSSLARWRGAERASSPDRISAHETHGYAAQILAHLDRLEMLEHAVVHCECWPSRLDASREDASYAAALGLLAKAVLATQGTGVHSVRGARLAVAQYFADGRSGSHGIRAIREEERCRTKDALERRSDAWKRLELIHNRAWEALDLSLREAGFVG